MKMGKLLHVTDAQIGKFYWMFKNDGTRLKMVECINCDGPMLRTMSGGMTSFYDPYKNDDCYMYEIEQPETMQYDLRRAGVWVEPEPDFDDTPSKLHF